MRDHSGYVVSRKYLNSDVDGSRPELEQFRKGITSLDCREATMSDMDSSADRPWTLEAVQQLRELARERVPVLVISLKLKRSIASIHAKLAEVGLTAPANA